MVGVGGIEPPATWTQTKRHTTWLHPVIYKIVTVGNYFTLRNYFISRLFHYRMPTLFKGSFHNLVAVKFGLEPKQPFGLLLIFKTSSLPIRITSSYILNFNLVLLFRVELKSIAYKANALPLSYNSKYNGTDNRIWTYTLLIRSQEFFPLNYIRIWYSREDLNSQPKD